MKEAKARGIEAKAQDVEGQDKATQNIVVEIWILTEEIGEVGRKKKRNNPT